MKITTAATLDAPPETVFGALLNPAILQRAIPGCESLVPTAEDEYKATLKIGVAGLNGTYSGSARLRDKRPPESVQIGFEGKGGPGFVRGTALVRLQPEGSGTHVSSEADVQVGGVIAAVGSRLVAAAARKLSDDFFVRLAAEIADGAHRSA
jgi:carbon monoxide dehydrogenase subunit G